jgi:hypothetical protein
MAGYYHLSGMKAFRLIVVRYERQADLFDDRPRSHVIASSRSFHLA